MNEEMFFFGIRLPICNPNLEDENYTVNVVVHQYYVCFNDGGFFW